MITIISAALLLSCAAHAQPGPTLRGTGTTGNSSYVVGLSADGTRAAVAIGYENSATFGCWSIGDGLVEIGKPAGSDAAYLYGISGDGKTFVGNSMGGGERPVQWTSEDGFAFLPGIPNDSYAYATNASYDGSVIVGWGQPISANDGSRGLRWESTGSLTVLAATHSLAECEAYLINSTGQYAAGESFALDPRMFITYFPSVWNGTSGSNVPTPGGTFRGNATAISGDGQVLYCKYETDSFDGELAYKWSSAGGVQPVNGPADTHYISTLACNADGSVAVGYVSTFSDSDGFAFLMTPALGLVNLNTHLASIGVDMTGWVLRAAYAVSADGTIIGGYGVHNGIEEGFVVDLGQDQDDDGLKDDWEINGIPYIDHQGVLQRFVLDADGDGTTDAHPLKKDLFVEIDSMLASLSQKARTYLVDAFARAPLSNPDGTTGVRLHIQFDEPAISFNGNLECSGPGCMPDDFQQRADGYFMKRSERQRPDADQLRSAKEKAYRYGMIAFDSDSDSGGCGYVSGDRFVVYSNPMRSGPLFDLDIASVIMHELGHNLGLEHGGGDDVNGKVNYPSIMNYALSYKEPWNAGFWKLDYSRAPAAALPTVVESSLDETVGIGAPGQFYSGWSLPFWYTTTGANGLERTMGYARLDGRTIDFGSPAAALSLARDGQFTSGVVQDLNFESYIDGTTSLTPNPVETFTPYDDWGRVVLATDKSRGSLAARSSPHDELTHSERVVISAFPPPPCRADIAGVGAEPFADGQLDNNDFIVFIGWFFDRDIRADRGTAGGVPGIDDELDNNDFIVFISEFFEGC